MKKTKAYLLAAALSSSVSVAALADGIPGAPPSFDKGGVQLAFISYLSQGDYFESYEADVARQAKALGVSLHIFQGKQDAALEREQVEQAINLCVKGILITHGEPEALKDVVPKAVDAGIKVVIKDVALDNPKVPVISQNDHAIAQAVLDQALKDNGKAFNAGYVYVSGSSNERAGARSIRRRRPLWATRPRRRCAPIRISPSCSRPTTSSRAA
jgi:simple sugar transport system substrate-binding protein